MDIRKDAISETSDISVEVQNGEQPTVNYSRWMTDNAAALSGLRLDQLTLPSAHNSGMDMQDLWGVDELMGACQDDTFSFQLNAGARVLDLRLYDRSYRKPNGNHSGHWTFREEFIFTHGPFPGRKLADCISGVDSFTRNNPGEIVILDIHEYHLGKYPSNSVNRCLKYFDKIRDRLIPPSAHKMTIGEIRTQHPGKNIIIAWDRGNGFWGKIQHEWMGQNFISESEIVRFCKEKMEKPPATGMWSLSAAAYSSTGAIRMNSSKQVWQEIFRPGFQNANIINVDFIQQTGIIDKCIALNIERGKDKIAPTAFSGFRITQLVDPTSQKHIEEAKFEWNLSTDTLGVRAYEVLQNGEVFLTTGSNSVQKKVPMTPDKYKVHALDYSGNVSADSAEISPRWIEDTPPTVPTLPRALQSGLYTVELAWEPSSDNAGVEGYQVKKNGQDQAFVRNPNYKFTGLSPEETFNVEVRAKDISGNWSAPLNIPVGSRPIVPKANEISVTRTLIPDTQSYVLEVSWPITWPSDPFSIYIIFFGQFIHRIKTESNQLIASHRFNMQNKDETFGIQYVTDYGTSKEEVSEVTSYTTDFYPAPFSAPSNLEGKLNYDPLSITLTWKPSTGDEVTSYNVSCNEQILAEVPASQCTYTTTRIQPDFDYVFEVWAVNSITGKISLPISIEVKAPPSKPTKPENLEIISISHRTATLMWTASTDDVAVVGYRVYLNASPMGTVAETTYDFTGLSVSTYYTARVVALDAAHNESEAGSCVFRTLIDDTAPDKPTELRAFNVSSEAATLLWKRPDDDVGVVKYEIFKNDDMIDESDDAGYIAKGLTPRTPYRFAVRALDAAGNCSELSETICVETYDFGPPVNPRTVETGKYSVKFKWDRPVDTDWMQLNYIIVVTKPGGGTIRYDIPFQELQVGLLLPATHYQVTISAIDLSANLSSTPLTFSIATEGATPQTDSTES